MINIELQRLVKKLAPDLKNTLEDAVGKCVSLGHVVVEPEHWFSCLLATSRQWQSAVQYTSVSADTLSEQLAAKLARLVRGSDHAPSLSPQLVELLKDSWLLASMDDTPNQVNGFHLLLVLKQRIDQGSYQGELGHWLSLLSLEWLRAQAKNASLAGKEKVTQSASPVSVNNETPALDKYSLNLTQAARDGELDPVTGRGDEIRKSIDILCRRRQNSPILVGDPGVGKTAIVEGLAQQVADGNVPPALANVELRSLDLSLLQAGASIKGEFENRLKDVISEIKASSVPIIMFIDEAHTLIGAGGTAGQNDAANILKPALARGEFRSLAATTWAEYKQYFESDAALARRFQLVAVSEPNEQQAIQMLNGVKKSLEAHHKVKIRQEAVEAAVSLSVRYLPERKLPDKAISLLDTACSRIGLSQSATPASLDSVCEQLRHSENDIATLEHEAALWSVDEEKLNRAKQQRQNLLAEKRVLEARWEREKALVAEIQTLHDSIDAAFIAGENSGIGEQKAQLAERMTALAENQGESPLVMSDVCQQTVAEVIALWTGIPAGKMLQQDMANLKHIERHIGQRVIGQTAPIHEIAKAIRMSRTGLTDPRKPVGVFMMCGPSGVGKTETALALTDLLYGGEKNITVINMTEFKEQHKVSMLLGSPAGYVGYGKGGVLTEAVRKNPYSVLLLDEMEKAHPGVHDVFYQIFDKGEIADSEGRRIDFRNTIIIMTSNAADSAVVNACAEGRPSVPALTATIFPELKQAFKPAFLGRITIVPYFPLNDEEMADIAALSLKRVERRIQDTYGAQFSYQPSVIDRLVSLNSSPETGARAIEQLINRQLLPELANQCISCMGEGKTINQVVIGVEGDTFSVQIH
ncbi:type VI secretion system ATPase TssH [Veronia pacifica]|uniref:ClpV1 family T6SS ATPase n=1 Tax=Veronia pacifica TaxID=1080227 RepID=A0A1C3EDR0_9GAMM|nr:type VI secretion system ATPase TssH [Veronia pacifica]ODA31368.1 ClpV1 family T6SS ATPase [Veronia pacifica]